MNITLRYGTLDPTPNLDGWIITSEAALAVGAEDVPLRYGDRITLHGDVIRAGQHIANIG